MNKKQIDKKYPDKKLTKEQIIKSIIKTYILSYGIECNENWDIEQTLKTLVLEVVIETLR